MGDDRAVVYVDWWSMHKCMCPKGKEKHEPQIVKAWVCDTCEKPFVPKHWEDRYTTCQRCHYG